MYMITFTAICNTFSIFIGVGRGIISVYFACSLTRPEYLRRASSKYELKLGKLTIVKRSLEMKYLRHKLVTNQQTYLEMGNCCSP